MSDLKLTKTRIWGLRKEANKHIYVVLGQLGVTFEERYQYLSGACPVHNGDRKDAFSWHLEYGMWQCFSRGCHETFGKDIFGLVRGIRDIQWKEAVEYVASIMNLKEEDFKRLEDEEKNKVFVERQTEEKPIVYPEECLAKLSYHGYLETRGYPRWLVEKYQIGITSDKYKKMSNRVIIPIRNIDGQLVGFTGRSLFPDWKERGIGKWEHSKDFRKNQNLFNINNAAEHIRRTGTAIICEGPLDVLRLEEAGYHNSVAIFGRKLHNEQIGLLMKLNAFRLVLVLDADIAGRTGAESAAKAAANFFDIVKVDVGVGDVGQKTVEEVRKLLSNVEA
jgi:DNA primase